MGRVCGTYEEKGIYIENCGAELPDRRAKSRNDDDIKMDVKLIK